MFIIIDYDNINDKNNAVYKTLNKDNIGNLINILIQH